MRRREVVLRGFGTGDNHQNINSFRWSPGGELMFSQGLHAHARVETPHGIVALDEAGFFRFRPREMRLDAFYGGQAEPQNPWGFVWTDWGQMLMVAGNNGGIYYPLPEMIRGVQGGRRDQIWVNARGRKCSGPDIIGTAHLPPEWQGVMLSGGYLNNAVWALKIEDDGAGFKVTDLPPLLTSTDTSFRPVDVKIGPDGAIYICDWFNPIIGHYQASFRHPDRDKTHGRIWRVTAKGRSLVKPPVIAGAPLGELFENLKSPERWVREQSKRELAGRETDAVVKGLREWWPQVSGRVGVPPAGSGVSPERTSRIDGTSAKPTDASPPSPQDRSGRMPEPAGGTLTLPESTEHALVEALGVFEAHDSPEPDLLTKLCGAKEENARTYAATVIARWNKRMEDGKLPNRMAGDGAGDVLTELSCEQSLRVRLAAVAALGNLPESDSVIAAAMAPSDGDKFIELAARSSIAALRPVVDGMRARNAVVGGKEQPELFARIEQLQRPLTSTKLAAPAANAAVKPPAIPATGKLRATPAFVAELVREVKERGDAKHGAEIFRRPDLACTSCHSLEDQGGKIGPPLDSIGSGQPLDFIIGAVLEPQREIKESYEAMQITLKNGGISLGYIVARNAASTTLRDPATGGEQQFAAAEIAETSSAGSFMPAGLVDALPRADLRDLFRYLSELGKPKP